MDFITASFGLPCCINLDCSTFPFAVKVKPSATVIEVSNIIVEQASAIEDQVDRIKTVVAIARQL